MVAASSVRSRASRVSRRRPSPPSGLAFSTLPADAGDEAESLRAALVDTTGAEWSDALAARLDGRATIVAARVGARPVGMAVLRWDGPVDPAPRAVHAGMAEVRLIEVVASMRSQGVGSRLLAVCEGLVIARGHTSIGIPMAVGNIHAYALCLRLGYAEPVRVEYPPSTAEDGGGSSMRAATPLRFLVKTL